ncbi:FtsX-like permease family protein [Lutispora thermophila]|uniref:Putative ABC transport system permease protein n=1 Tax=Lutispora thermophila DSM 19022 TaxID=1122184 RepID=A0A1M6BAU2_9FIRM|nr:ABC transporter permease [Lutispora thermophila]SHI45849.1 putative ABC transport system permease protein [Lutispora thermophila DSM 19022]
MTLRDIAYKNIKGNFNRYVMYYLSNTLVVMVFFIFANFIFNPTVSKVGTLGLKGVMVANSMILCEVLIMVFTVLFTYYSMVGFLKSREKEFGLLSTFGLTKGDIRKYVIYENLIVTFVSVITGLLLGILFSKLFFMAITVIMAFDGEIPFSISLKAVGTTILSFVALFQGMSVLVTLRIKNNNIAELLKGSRVAQEAPKFSMPKTILAIVFIAVGYIMAILSGYMIILTMFPILFFTVTGTYFLFTQFSVFMTTKIKNNKRTFYKGTNIITLSQIVHRLKDNAKVLFIVAILGAVTLTASATVYSIQQSIKYKLFLKNPHDVSFMEIGAGLNDMSILEKTEDIFREHGLLLKHKNQVLLIKATRQGELKLQKGRNVSNPYLKPNTEDFYIMANSDYNKLAEQFKKQKVTLAQGEVYINSHQFNIIGIKSEKVFVGNEFITLGIKGENYKFKIKDESIGGVIDADNNKTNVAIVNDKDYESFRAKAEKEDEIMYYGYNIEDWQRSKKAVEEIASIVPENENIIFNDRIRDFVDLMQGMSLFLFIGTFISILFFIATGSIIYFKMFNEIRNDRLEFISLKKIGMAYDEIKQIVSRQSFIVFFLPFAVAFAHSTFAIIALSNLLGNNITLYFLTVVAIYLVFQTLYYVFAKTMYLKQIKNFEI